MENSNEFKFFGCFDILTSIFQVMVTCANTVISVSFHFNNGELDGTYRASNFLPAFILTGAVVIIYFHFSQIVSTRKLMRVGQPEIFKILIINICIIFRF